MSTLPVRRKRVLYVTHVVCSVGWIGLEASLLALGATGLTTHNPDVLRAVYIALGRLGLLLIAPFSLGALITGVALSLRTRWGLVKHWWVVVKLVITVVMTIASNIALNFRLQDAARRVSKLPLASLNGAQVGGVRSLVIASGTAAFILLLVATVLSVYKPWGPVGRRRPAADEAALLVNSGR
jgi:hypothetical protein